MTAHTGAIRTESELEVCPNPCGDNRQHSQRGTLHRSGLKDGHLGPISSSSSSSGLWHGPEGPPSLSVKAVIIALVLQ